MIFKIASTIDIALDRIDTAMAVLETAIERADRAESVKPETTSDWAWTQEIAYINKVMTGAFMLFKAPIEELEDVKGAAWQLHKEAQEAARSASEGEGKA